MLTNRGAGIHPRWPDRAASLVVRRHGGRRFRLFRRLIAIGLLLCAGAVAVAQQRTPGPGAATVTVAHDLTAGTTLLASDLTTNRVAQLPDGALTAPGQATGRVLAGSVRRGEILTDARLVPRSGPDPGPGRVAVPIRPADGGTVDLLSPGVHVAVIAVSDSGAGVTLASDAVVLSLPPPTDHSATAKRLVVLAVPTAVADRLAAAAVGGALALRFT